MKYNKSLHPDDYGELADLLPYVNHVIDNASTTLHHNYRRWEYAQGLRAAMEYLKHGDTVLEIGAGGSAMPCILALAGFKVTVVDPDGEINKQAGFAHHFGVELELVRANFMDFDDTRTFDGVICLSTIEHVPDDLEFLLKASKAAKKVLVVSTDFHPDGGQHTPHHLRAYSESDLDTLEMNIVGWQLADEPEWFDNGGHVNGYNFASMVLVPAGKTKKPEPASKAAAADPKKEVSASQ